MRAAIAQAHAEIYGTLLPSLTGLDKAFARERHSVRDLTQIVLLVSPGVSGEASASELA